eukprot:gnl/MRDRNA2_/MRDRNA2_85764_c0_seq1.p1 gnl/MRDRNA2_/MRDRNA2_85764_c0~~gnl/MRDRNA2_/MRDRNA2_85764_c0_seq1.p1  ORF type:complete len:104 (-),score=8.90 gnl/MRDRNA2_/MRDRNA2_85764_c0_seq1:96-407(-)
MAHYAIAELKTTKVCLQSSAPQTQEIQREQQSRLTTRPDHSNTCEYMKPAPELQHHMAGTLLLPHVPMYILTKTWWHPCQQRLSDPILQLLQCLHEDLRTSVL